MNFRDMLDEIGILETNLQIEKYINDSALISGLLSEIPIPTRCDTKLIIDGAVNKILELNKKNIFMLSNEIAMIEALIGYSNKIDDIIIGLSRNLSNEQIENIKKNIPKNSKISFLNELEYPDILKPKDSLILVFGYTNGNNCIVTNNTYRMIELYKSFLGKKVFIRCIADDVKLKQRNFISINGNNYFDVIL